MRTRPKSAALGLAAVIASALALVAGVASADMSTEGTPSGPPGAESDYQGTVELTCTDFTALNSGAHTLDRDNTGSGQERIELRATDGTGAEIYFLSYTNALGTYPAGIIGTTPYDTAPVANPITFTIVSPAGNGLPEQVDEVFFGSCETIPPTASVPAEAPLGDDLVVDGLGCPAGPVTAVLESGGTELATATGSSTGPGDPFTVVIAVPADAPVGAATVTVICGTSASPTSAPLVLDTELVAPAEPPPPPPPPPGPGPITATPTFAG